MEDFAVTCYMVKAADAGWLGDVRQVQLSEPSSRLKVAIAQHAAELDLEVEWAGPFLTIVTDTWKEHADADKLSAYIDGLRDALNDSYGNPPVEVGRKDLTRVLDALGRMMAGPDVDAAAGRLRQVPDGQPVSAP